MNCWGKLKRLLYRGVRNETTGGYLNYYLLKISEPEINKIIDDKLLVNWNQFFWLALTLLVMGLCVAVDSFI
jgi:hypothetical protein